jgi:hypothetical protein
MQKPSIRVSRHRGSLSRAGSAPKIGNAQHMDHPSRSIGARLTFFRVDAPGTHFSRRHPSSFPKYKTGSPVLGTVAALFSPGKPRRRSMSIPG